MKTFYTALCVFLLLCLAIICNVLFISQTAGRLTDMLNTLPTCEEAESEFEKLDAFWQRRRTAVSLSVSFDEIKDMDNCITSMRSALKSGDEKEFESEKALALNAVCRIQRLERLSLENIV